MPYASNAELPEAVKDVLPAAAQSVFRNVVNSQEARGLSTEQAFASAWGALKTQGWVKGDAGTWHKVDKILKVDPHRQYVFGWASVAVTKAGTQVEDLQGDLLDPEDLEDAAYQFALKFRGAGELHAGDTIGHLIESVVFTPDKLEAMGLATDALPQALWVGFHIPDTDIFQKVVDGTYHAFSIQGHAVREDA